MDGQQKRYSWFSQGGGYVSEAEKNEIYGRLSREVQGLDKEIAYLRAELNRIGTSFEVTGRVLKMDEGPIILDKDSIYFDLEKMFDYIGKYNEANRARASKQAELDRLG